MKRPVFFLPLATFAAVITARSAQAQELTSYTVQRGDTCPSIAQRLYGDVGRIDLIHQNNPMGRLPHRLRPGQVLRVPRTAAGARSASDARVSFVRNQVQAFTPDEHRARADESLSRGHRIGTLASSSAEVTFVDETQLQLGENTLVVILGRTSSRVDQNATSADATLSRGTLRSHLAALAGQAAPRPVSVTTPSGQVQMGTGESQVGVDERATTRLAVYNGSGQIRSRGRSVQVPQGFGSRADRGRPPSAPRPLPAQPTWTTNLASLTFLEGSTDVELRGVYARGASGPAPVAWHVQLARDARFNDLVVDTRVALAVNELRTRVQEGAFFVRVSALDADGFEGPYTQAVPVRVATMALVPGGPGRRAQVNVSLGLFCSLDDAPFTAVRGPISLSPAVNHRLRCAANASRTNNEGVDVRMFSPSESAPVLVRARAGAASYEGERGQRTITLRVSDATGAPLSGIAVTATAPAGTTVSAVSATDVPGTYTTTLRWTGALPRGDVAFRVGDGEQTSLAIEATEAPHGPRTRLVPPPPRTGLELALVGEAYPTFSRLRTAIGVGLEARVRFPSGPGFFLGFRASHERFGCTGTAAGTAADYCTDLSAAPMNPAFTSVLVEALSVGPVLGAWLVSPERLIAPYFSLTPQWIYFATTVTSPTGTAVESRSTLGLLATVGVQLRIAEGNGLFVDVGYREARGGHSTLREIPLAGLAFHLGYRVLF